MYNEGGETLEDVLAHYKCVGLNDLLRSLPTQITL